jgi:hypothetical protein
MIRMVVVRTLAVVLVLALASPAVAQAPATPPTQAPTPSTPFPGLDLNKVFDALARTLAGAIQQARDESVKAGVQPIPPAMRKQLAAVFPIELLDRVRYRVGKEGSLAMQAFHYGHVQAVTLIDVIVFRNENDALTNDVLWAHELTHVRQYDRWGLEEFARRYAGDHKSVEAEAYGFQSEYEARKKGAAR